MHAIMERELSFRPVALPTTGETIAWAAAEMPRPFELAQRDTGRDFAPPSHCHFLELRTW